MTYEIEYDRTASEGRSTADHWGFQPTFIITGASRVVRVAGRLARLQLPQLVHDLTIDSGTAAGEGSAQRALITWTLERAAQELPLEDGYFDVTDDELASVGSASRKACDYFLRSGRDAYCLCASTNDESQVGVVDGRRAAPTSSAVCSHCDLPDTRLLCNHLMHPQVMGVRTIGSYSRSFAGGLCDQGFDDRVRSAHHQCVPGGHECWRRSVDPPSNGLASSDLPLAEALDFLDVTWRLAFGSYLLGRSTVAHTVGLGAACDTRDEFAQRMNSLADVLDNLLVPSSTSTKKNDGPLVRLEAWLPDKLTDHPSDLANALAAVLVLRNVNAVRNAMTHSDAARKLPAALAPLGIPYPPRWSAAWESVRRSTSSAATTLRNSLRPLVP